MASPHVVAIIQARMGSSRLPGKVLADLGGRPMLWRVVSRVRMARTVHQAVVATTVSPKDDQVADYCRTAGIACFRGSESDVLDRYYQAALQYRPDVVVRVTADCPFIDPQVIDRIVGAFLEGGCDYATNVIRYTYPHGLDTEVFSFAALETAWRDGRQPSEREHVTPYIRNSGRFRLRNVEHETDLSVLNLRWTVDEPSDLEFARTCYARLGERQDTFGFADVLRLLEKEPDLQEINRHNLGHEGYYKSLAHDDPVEPLEQAGGRSGAPARGPLAAPVRVLEQGARVRDVDGNEFIDTDMAGGAAILGHGHAAVTRAVREAGLAVREVGRAPAHPAGAAETDSFALQVAETLAETVPGAEAVCLLASGEGALKQAVAAAKRHTGREDVVVCSAAPLPPWASGEAGTCRAVGVAALRKLVSERRGRLAAILAVPFGEEQEVGGLLAEARELAAREGALLIVDERHTAFRLAPGGAQAFFGVAADLVCIGPAMANGHPIGAVAGRQAIVQLVEPLNLAGVQLASLAAALATLREVRHHEVGAQIRNHGQKWRDGLNVLAREFGLSRRVRAVGLTACSVVSFTTDDGAPDPELGRQFGAECQTRGVLFTGIQCVSTAHTNADVEYVLRVYRSALEALVGAR